MGTSDPTWTPIDELNRTDADVSVPFLTSNSIIYNEPVDDDLFSAHQPANLTEPSYSPDVEVTAMGCTEQFQFCEVSRSPNPKCTNLTGWNPLFVEME